MSLKIKKRLPEIITEPGIVKIQTKKISISFLQFTKAFLSTAPIPITPAVIT
jgi:hypothetical protein